MASKVMPESAGADGIAANVLEESHGLRRAVGVWGSYTWGYADVGADVYVALGIVMAQLKELQTSPFYLQVSSM